MTAPRRQGTALAAFALVASAAGCTPDVGNDPVPEALEFDTEAAPPRVPQPTGLVVNPLTGHIDFGLAGTPLPDDCSRAQGMSPAECQFDHYLETLDGFPTVSPAAAPATAPLATDTLTTGKNVVAVALRDPEAVPNLFVGFDDASRSLALRPLPSWALGEYYFFGVRAYGGGVRASSGKEVVGSPTFALLKEDSSLTCGATSPDALDPSCPAYELLSQSQPPAEARANVFTLELVRQSYAALGVWQRLAAAGLPKEETGIAFGFPVHTGSVAELDPTVGLVPHVTAPNEIRIGVHGPVDPATVSAFVVRERPGPVVVMDLTAAATGNLVTGFPRVDARFAGGSVVISGEAPFSAGHQYGIFISRDVRAPSGASLVPAPISVLLTLTAPLVDDQGKSQLSSVSDADAAALEAGRQELATLFDNPVFGPLTALTRESLVYCFAFTFQAPS
ncbi:MAG TPA: hypothetical protein VFV94_01660 [Polyangiaceae bacterium]|nr:hypothetical protein [Polyangiaceae bacterium]